MFDYLIQDKDSGKQYRVQSFLEAKEKIIFLQQYDFCKNFIIFYCYENKNYKIFDSSIEEIDITDLIL